MVNPGVKRVFWPGSRGHAKRPHQWVGKTFFKSWVHDTPTVLCHLSGTLKCRHVPFHFVPMTSAISQPRAVDADIEPDGKVSDRVTSVLCCGGSAAAFAVCIYIYICMYMYIYM